MRIGAAICAVGVLLAVAPAAMASAISTTIDPGYNFPTGTLGAGSTATPVTPTNNGCEHGTANNCNDYFQDQDVFLSGLPNELGPGTYYWAVLDPNQKTVNVNDGEDGNLSSAFDDWTNREFTINSDGSITYSGEPGGTPHAFDTANQALSVYPFEPTANKGGVFTLAVCQVPAAQLQNPTTGVGTPGVGGGVCKFNAFKVEPANSGGGLADLSVFKTANPAFVRTYSWDVTKSVNKTEIDTSSGTGATFNYTVNATWGGPKDSGWNVYGQITLTNPNDQAFAGVTLSDVIWNESASPAQPDPNASCTISDLSGNVITGDQTIPAKTVETYNYNCAYSAPPAGTFEENIVTANWAGSTYGTPDDSTLWPAPFAWDTFSSGNPQVNDNCATVTDDFNSAMTPDVLGDVCQDGVTASNLWSKLSSPPSYDSATNTWTFQYSRTITAPTGTCQTYDNTANFNTDTLHDSEPNTSANEATVKVCGASDLSVAKTANTSYTRTYDWNIQKSADQSGQVIQSGNTLGVNYTVQASQTGVSDSNVQAAGTITISNPNDWEPIQLSNVSDPSTTDGGTCTYTDGTGGNATAQVPEASGGVPGTLTLDYACSYSGDSGTLPADGTNTATADWSGGNTPHTSSSDTVPVSFTGATVTRVDQSVTPTDTSAAFNGGAAEDLCQLDSSQPCQLTGSNDLSNLAGATYHYERTLTGTPGTCVTYDNTAGFVEISPTSTWSVQLCQAVDLQVAKTANTSYTRTYSWTIKKTASQTGQVIQSASTLGVNYQVTASQTGITDSQVQATGTITVTNPNDFEDIPLTGVSDASTTNGGTCSFTSGNTTATVASNGGTTVLDYTCTFPNDSGTLPANGTNTATASWSQSAAGTPDGSAQDSVPVDFGSPSSVVDQKVTPTDTFDGGSGVNLCTLDTTNAPGSCTLTASDDPTKLTSQTYNYSRTINGTPGTCTPFSNTAGFTNGDPSATSETSGSLCVAEDLSVVKTVKTSYTRTYNWTIVKTVNQNKFDQSGGSVTPSYKVVVTEGAPTDKNVQATGTITITNPNTFEDIALTGVTDPSTTNGGTCSFTSGNTAATVGKNGGTAVLNYVCSFANDSGTLPKDGTNTATAMWSAATANTPDGSSSNTAAVSFTGATVTPVNKTITPTDAFNGGTGVNLCTLQTGTPCTLTATDPPAAVTSQTYTYTRTIAVTQNACVIYPNTAATGTGQTSGASVTVCGGVIGGLTMGFWQNKNGQGIITATATNQVKLAAWLEGYNPFKDLATWLLTKGNTIASYVTNVIKSATCSTTATGPCNAMLKAQMLATALDVYFSDPTLGGNQIGAFTVLGSKELPVGGLNVDLSQICAMSDGTTSSTCTGTFGNVGPAFGAPPASTCQTVSALLAFSNATTTGSYPWGGTIVSNAGGTSWYNQNKTYQVEAKNAFDAVNNGNAFSC